MFLHRLYEPEQSGKCTGLILYSPDYQSLAQPETERNRSLATPPASMISSVIRFSEMDFGEMDRMLRAMRSIDAMRQGGQLACTLSGVG